MCKTNTAINLVSIENSIKDVNKDYLNKSL